MMMLLLPLLYQCAMLCILLLFALIYAYMKYHKIAYWLLPFPWAIWFKVIIIYSFRTRFNLNHRMEGRTTLNKHSVIIVCLFASFSKLFLSPSFSKQYRRQAQNITAAAAAAKVTYNFWMYIYAYTVKSNNDDAQMLKWFRNIFRYLHYDYYDAIIKMSARVCFYISFFDDQIFCR